MMATTALLAVSVLLAILNTPSNGSTALGGTQGCSGRMCNPSTRSIAPPTASEDALVKQLAQTN